MAKVYGFTNREDVPRVGRVVKRVEGGAPPGDSYRQNGNRGDFGRVLIGKSNSAIAKGTGATDNVSLWDGVQGSETDTTIDVTVWNYLGDIASGKWVVFVETVRGYVAIAAEC